MSSLLPEVSHPAADSRVLPGPEAGGSLYTLYSAGSARAARLSLPSWSFLHSLTGRRSPLCQRRWVTCPAGSLVLGWFPVSKYLDASCDLLHRAHKQVLPLKDLLFTVCKSFVSTFYRSGNCCSERLEPPAPGPMARKCLGTMNTQ